MVQLLTAKFKDILKNAYSLFAKPFIFIRNMRRILRKYYLKSSF